MRVVGVSYRIGTTELRAMVVDEEKKQLIDVRVRWFSVDPLPPKTWAETALAEAKQAPAQPDPIAQMFNKLR